MANLKTFPRGSTLLKEGEKVTSLFIVESGTISVGIQKGKFFFELYNVGKMQILGETALFGATTFRGTAVASSEVKVLEIPIEAANALVEQSHQTVKILWRALGDRLKWSANEVRTAKLEKDPTPCPQAQIPKAFGAVFHAANHTGQREPQRVTVDWRSFKTYCTRIFFEEPKRVESVVHILVKLKLAELEHGRNEDDPKSPEELMKVHFLDLVAVEQFFEFYQHYLNKSGKQDFLKVEDTNFFLVEAMLKDSQGLQPDRLGSVRLDFGHLEETLKKDSGVNLNKDHFGALELKGLFVKRAAASDGKPYIAFNYQEFASTFQHWKFILEVEQWNENGAVDVASPAIPKRKLSEPTGHTCPECQSDVQGQQKFCGNCGTKLAVAA